MFTSILKAVRLWIITVLLLPFSLLSQIPEEKINAIDAEIQHWIDQGDLVGAEILIIKDEKTLYQKAFGWADKEEDKTLQNNTIWSIKSMSKPVAATAILQLMEQGKLTLEDKVSDYISGFQGNPETTIAHLLSHSSGWSGLGGNMGNYKTIEDWVQEWGAQTPTSEFGTYSYSDFNYAALGFIIEKVSGMPANIYIDKNILEPLGIQELHTMFSPSDAWANRVSSRYLMEYNQYTKYWSPQQEAGWAFYPAAWGIWGTGQDYAKFMQLWMNKGTYNGVRILKEATIENALQYHSFRNDRGQYGLGWFLEDPDWNNNMPRVFNHGGFDGTRAYAFPEDNLVVLYLSQSRGVPGYGKGWFHLDAFTSLITRLDIVDLTPRRTKVQDAELHDQTALVRELEPFTSKYLYTIDGNEALKEVSHLIKTSDNHFMLRIRPFGLSPYLELDLIGTDKDHYALGTLVDGKPEYIMPGMTVSFTETNGEKMIHLDSRGERYADGKPISDSELQALETSWKNTRSLGEVIGSKIEKDGLDAALAYHQAILESKPDTVLMREQQLNILGYQYLQKNDMEKALAVFKMNIKTFPEAANPYDSYGEALERSGDIKAARDAYAKAVSLAEGADDQRLEMFKSNLERVEKQIEQPVPAGNERPDR